MPELYLHSEHEYEKLEQLVDNFYGKATHRLKFNTLLVLEELVSNIFKYGHPLRSQEPVHIRLEQDGNEIRIDIRDKGIPFDPLDVKDPDLLSDLKDRQVGGLGIFLVKRHASCISYNRINEHNITSVTLEVKKEGLKDEYPI